LYHFTSGQQRPAVAHPSWSFLSYHVSCCAVPSSMEAIATRERFGLAQIQRVRRQRACCLIISFIGSINAMGHWWCSNCHEKAFGFHAVTLVGCRGPACSFESSWRIFRNLRLPGLQCSKLALLAVLSVSTSQVEGRLVSAVKGRLLLHIYLLLERTLFLPSVCTSGMMGSTAGSCFSEICFGGGQLC
jgi:hypothetical protein